MARNHRDTDPTDVLVLFAITGDLAHKMIIPALYALVKRGTLTVPIIAVALPKWSEAQLHARVIDSLEQYSNKVVAEAPSHSHGLAQDAHRYIRLRLICYFV